MDQNSRPNTIDPVEPTMPEEDPTLLAIEALEARAIDDNPTPLSTPRDIPVPPRLAPVPPPAPVPKVIEPIIPKPAAPQPAPTVPKPVPEPPKPTPKAEAPQVPETPPKPKKPTTPAEAIAEELAHAPTTRGFQFFTNHAAPRKPFIIVGIIVVVVALGVGAYFFLR